MPDGAAPRGMVFNIQGYSIHDGPGIRTTVFLKGCTLRCAWCQNPESQQSGTELFFDADACRGCGACAATCPTQAVRIVGGKASTDRSRCDGRGDCVAVCPAQARSSIGESMTVDRVVEEVLADRAFYARSGGGVTLSGGEPLAQPLFAAEVLRRCRAAGVHTALDTCGHAPWNGARRVLEHVDLVLYDFKHMDDAQHRALTGAGNAQILANARRIHHELKIPMLARVPVIPGANDSAENLEATARFIAEELSPSIPVHLNAYHRFGEAKAVRLERPGEPFTTAVPDDMRMAGIRETFAAHGLATVLGG